MNLYEQMSRDELLAELAKRDLQASEREREPFFKFFHSSDDLMVIADASGCFTKVNPACTRVLGYGEQELLSRPFVDFVHPDDRQATLEEIARHAKSDLCLDFENRYLRKDGSVCCLSWHANYLAEEGVTYASARDVTESRQTQEKLNRILREQHVILDSAPIGICMLIDRKLILANRHAQELFLYTKEELEGQSTRLLYPAQELYERVGREAYSRLSQGLEFESVQQMRRRDGSLLWVRLHGRAVEPPDLSKGSIWMLENITERKQLQDELLNNQNQLQTANELLEQRVVERTSDLEAAVREQESFSYSVSHDLRAPLRHINSFSTILIEEYAKELPANARDYLERICAASQRMATLIDQLLELSRVAKARIDLQTVDLSELADATLRMFHETEPGRCPELVVEKGLTVLGDHNLLRQMLENLLGNAWKYTSKIKKPRIQFGRALLFGKEAYFVKDNGAGFEMDYREKIFHPFERLHGAEFEGLGIGLATVQRIVQRHGGTIWAEGQVGQGATFYFTLQLASF